MLGQKVRDARTFVVRRIVPAAAVVSGLLASTVPSMAQASVSVGAGLRTSFVHTDNDDGSNSDRLPVDSVRIYLNGQVNSKVKFMLNTEYNSGSNQVGILDAVARIELAPTFNIWAGRVLPPSDRANLAGPYYNSNWAVYTDGIQNGHPAVFQGRDNGVVYWGDFLKKKMKVSLGAFDGPSASGKSGVLGAARVQFDFWDPEDGYYLNSTYYGGKKLLSLGLASQLQNGGTASTIDFLLERKLADAGVITLEGEYANYNRLGGYYGGWAHSQGAYGTVAYILPKSMGPGKLQLLGKFAKADFTKGTSPLINPNFNQKTTEVNVNYLIKEFNARVMTFYKKTDFDKVKISNWQAGIGFQIQM
jgi:hypothetical protein